MTSFKLDMMLAQKRGTRGSRFSQWNHVSDVQVTEACRTLAKFTQKSWITCGWEFSDGKHTSDDQVTGKTSDTIKDCLQFMDESTYNMQKALF